AFMAEFPQMPIPARIELSAEQIMLGARPVQNIAVDIRSDTRSWAIERLDCRAPGATTVSLTGNTAPLVSSNFAGALSLESSDPDALAAWLQDRTEPPFRSRKPLRLKGDLSIAEGSIAIEGMNAEIDGGAVEGRLAFSNRRADAGSR